MSNGFKTEIDVNITGDESGHPNGSGGRGILKWTCQFDLGSGGKDPMNPEFFGIKGMIITVPDQEITFISNFYDEDTGEETEKEITISIKDVKIHDSLGECCISSFQLLPVELNIFKDKNELLFT